jgi:hypothetical protein
MMQQVASAPLLSAASALPRSIAGTRSNRSGPPEIATIYFADSRLFSIKSIDFFGFHISFDHDDAG